MNVISTESINTNNGWGFGGKSGTLTKYDNGLEVFSGKYHYRHHPSSDASYVRFTYKGKQGQFVNASTLFGVTKSNVFVVDFVGSNYSPLFNVGDNPPAKKLIEDEYTYAQVTPYEIIDLGVIVKQ